jgi:hypothetical protein
MDQGLVEPGRLQQVIGSQDNGEHCLGRAARTLSTASDIVDDDPDSAYILAYDPARYAGTALLAQQGLDPPPAAATTPSSSRCGPNSATDSAPSAPCDAAATNHVKKRRDHPVVLPDSECVGDGTPRQGPMDGLCTRTNTSRIMPLL